jgi:Ca2+-binding RTX toxin-like protein
MPELRVVTTGRTAGDADVSAITDLAFLPGSGPEPGEVLVSTTGWDGGLTTWDISGTGLARIDGAGHGRPGTAGSAPSLTVIDIATGTGTAQALFPGGGIGGPLRLVPVTGAGDLGAASRPGALVGIAGDVGGTVAVPLDGGTMVYGAPGSGAGIARLRFGPGGMLAASATTADSGATHADGVVLAAASVDGQDWLVSAGQRDPGVTLWQIGAHGALSARASLAPESGLWIAAPAAMEMVRSGGESFAVLASAGSSSLSLLRIGAGGSLAVTNHLIDDRDSRIAGVTTLATAELAGRAYVVAGGADDGISLYELLPGGRLLARAHLADATDTMLANVSALALGVSAGGLDIFVASESEPGLTRLRFDPGAAGTIRRAEAGGSLAGTLGADLLLGGAGSDRIGGGAGDDVIGDGAGADTLFGGAGADIFVLARDGVADRIADFDPGADRLDLSGWAGLRSLEQITTVQIGGALRLSYGDEVLVLDGMTRAALAGVPLFGGTHLGLAGEPGLPGPGQPDPTLPTRPDDGRPDPRGPVTDPNPENPGAPPTRQRGTPGDDALRGSWVSDLLIGRGGEDALRGRGAGDVLRGGGADDRLWGGRGGDRLEGGRGADRLIGGQGGDRLVGGRGDDLLRGGGGADIFDLRGATGRDRIADFDPGVDVIDLEGHWRLGALDIGETRDGDARIRIGADLVILDGIDPESLRPRDFDF